ncbi:Clp protease [Listeria floridensis FSL S10-1187]|uniref:ATP-dependent Clp protease proteolytic subunit n=1 Tax=Listeria floridensis FSL S10-1187 TaxID=1265817 RepID=A0ABN0RI01_9LIST|nr:head maturation protease, ClpP-related [Listeria floridensis]EUJ33527.1 Clp protease [Listeria floridensis FSL S10-1187]
MKKLNVKGVIVSNSHKWIYDEFEMESTAPKDILNELSGNEPLEVTINSYGGLVDAGNEIYTALRLYPGKVTVNVVMAGSAASIIAMAGDITRISPVGQIMIHNVSMGAGGDYHDMNKASEILEKANLALSNAYVQKTNLSQDEILQMMDSETWLTADEAKEKGFVDEIMFELGEQPMQFVANAGSGLLSPKIINKMSDLKQNKKVSLEIPEGAIKDAVNQAIAKLCDETIIEGKTLQEWINESEVSSEKEEPKGVEKNTFERFFFNT